MWDITPSSHKNTSSIIKVPKRPALLPKTETTNAISALKISKEPQLIHSSAKPSKIESKPRSTTSEEEKKKR